MKAEVCTIYHAANRPFASVPGKKKSRIFKSPDEKRVMGLIDPIKNTPSCSNGVCHAHPKDQTILGILDVKMDLSELVRAAFRNRLVVYGISIILILVAIFIFALVLYWVIHRPIHKLQSGVVHLSVGELDYRTDMERWGCWQILLITWQRI